jgi:hypothetical protein
MLCRMSALRSWLVPLSAAFMTGALLSLGAVVAGPGCQTRCETLDDCGGGSFCREGRCETECSTNEDCITPPECQGNPTNCIPKGLRCNALGQCTKGNVSRIVVVTRDGPEIEEATDIDGWDDRPGTGRAFIISELAIADQNRGFDIDGRCRGPGECIDNALYRLGQLGNDQIRQGLLGGETLLLVEFAGLDVDTKGIFRGNDRTLAVKFYGARDADDPFYPGNNFQIPAGEAKCCEFKINPQSIQGVPLQARARAPARIERWRMRSLAEVPIQFTLTVGQPPHPEIRVERVLLSAELTSNLGVIRNGLLGGAVPVSTLAQTENPYCRTLNNLCQRSLPNSTLIDLIASILPPDIDISKPQNGLELLEVGPTGRISRCTFADGGVIPPVDATQPWTCALQPEMADGYSVGITFAGVGARVVGVGQ